MRTTLGDVAKVGTGQSAPQDQSAFSKTGYPFVRAGSLERLIAGANEDTLEKIEPANAKKYGLKLLPKDTVVFAKSGMSAMLGRVYRLKTPCYVVSHLATIEPSENLDSGYLHRWFEANPPSQLINNDAYPSIKTSVISAIEFNLPPINEQLRIAAIFDKADAIRQKRQQTIQLAEQFLRATFLDMFGDPVTNPNDFRVGTIRELVNSVNYGTSSKADSVNGAYPILRMGNITYEGGWDFSDLKYIDLKENEREKYLVRRGDLLFNRTNSKELVGKTAVFESDQQMAIAGYLIRVRTAENANPYYISAYLNSTHGKATLRNMCKSIVGMANINAQELQDIRIMIPPKALQNEYERITVAVKSKVKTMLMARDECELLFNSIRQKAFSGQL